MNRTGEMQEPCGTPTCTCLCGEVVLRCRQLAIRPRRYADSQRTVLCGSVVCVSEVMSLVWLTMSKALEKSIDMVSVRCGGLGWLKPEATVCVRGMSAVVVLCRVLKPCWEGIELGEETFEDFDCIQRESGSGLR